ncbi:MAG: siderophore-interacting protein [Nocardiaceae bacterium]|nr:siderophore-interacting protein [Nocardiaceae bacterium]
MPRQSRKPREMHLCRVAVSRVVDLGPSLRRITFTGSALEHLPYAGPDQRVKLLFAADSSKLPDVEGPFSAPRFMGLWAGSAFRGIAMRTYTIRHHRPSDHEVDIDFALHGPVGLASKFATEAEVGDEMTIYGPVSDYVAPPEGAWILIGGDDTAAPAIAAILESLPRDAVGKAFVEVGDSGDVQSIEAPAGVEVTWLDREGAPTATSLHLRNAVCGTAIPEGPRWVWLAGESSVVTSIRRYLVNDRGVDRRQISFTGYWKHGKFGV